MRRPRGEYPTGELHAREAEWMHESVSVVFAKEPDDTSL